MTCPRCRSEINRGDKACPHCGISILRSIAGVMRTSAVMIAAGDEGGFYHSVEDVPEPLRRKLIESTTGSNSQTIIIADRAGRERLNQALLQQSLKEEVNAPVPADTVRRKRLTWLAWMGVALVLTLAALFIALFPMRW